MLAIYVHNNAKDFDCKKCTHKHCDTDKKWPGSKGPAGHNYLAVDGFESSTCFLPMITTNTHELLKIHRHYKNNHLLVDGGLLNQPQYYLTAMEIIDANYHDPTS